MALKISDALRNGMLQGTSVKELLDGGFIYIYAGAEPATADTALDMTNTHTQLAKIAADATPVDSGVTGLLFAATATSGALAKSAAQTWAAVINNVGFGAGTNPKTAVFYRFTSAADNGQAIGGGATPRVQGTVAVSGGDINLTSVSLTDNGTNTIGLSTYELRMPAS